MICGLAGPSLSADEAAFFKETNPLGFILFARNCETPEQVKTLTASLHDCMGREVPILIDQEGGRVQRLRPPHWTDYPPARSFGEKFMRDFEAGRTAATESATALAAELRACGVNVNCAPVLDVLFPETHEIIGDRAFGKDPDLVAALGAIVCRAYQEQGIVPIIKHIPGHGRARADSHLELPIVDTPLAELQRTDFRAFREVMDKAFSEGIWGMTAHVIYTAVDGHLPASCSRKVVFDIIRRDINFDGLLLSDDVSMEALACCGDLKARTTMVLRAGCDIALHCNGAMTEMQAVAAGAKKMTNEAVMRYNRSVEFLVAKARKREDRCP